MKAIFAISILLLLLIAGCSQQSTVIKQKEPLCNPPYIEYKQGECCLDQNSNNVCDNDEKQEEVKPIEFVCPNGDTFVTTEVNHIFNEEKDCPQIVTEGVEAFEYECGDWRDINECPDGCADTAFIDGRREFYGKRIDSRADTPGDIICCEACKGEEEKAVKHYCKFEEKNEIVDGKNLTWQVGVCPPELVECERCAGDDTLVCGEIICCDICG